MPGQGVTSMFSFGAGFGEILGVCLSNGYTQEDGNLFLIPPQRWKKAFGLIGKDKSASIEIAKAFWPGTNFVATPRSRKPADGLCEAALIALYGAEYAKKGKL